MPELRRRRVDNRQALRVGKRQATKQHTIDEAEHGGSGKPDGDYGPSTMNAVERFQIAHNLGEDGIVGPATLAALQKALQG